MRTVVVRARRRLRRALDPCRCRMDGVWYWLAFYWLGRSIHPTSTVAVVVHVYHFETWPAITRHLESLAVPVNLFVTMPARNLKHVSAIRGEQPTAHVMIVPNRGRDILPFVRTAAFLLRHDYATVLKLHSKRTSLLWSTIMLDGLLPESPALLEGIVEQMESSVTGVLAPSEVYFPLAVSSAPELRRVSQVVRETVGGPEALEVLRDTRSYGYFAGSMFWARLDAIEPVLRYGACDFEPELGQWTGSFAHALERAFSLVPHLSGRQNVELRDGRPQPRAGRRDDVPAWYLDIVDPTEARRLMELMAGGAGQPRDGDS